MKVIKKGGIAEIVEKKSRFIAATNIANTEEEALDFIENIRKEHWNARHNCFAYVIGDKHQVQRCSDDGEPSGTAGRPMLDILLGEDIHNIVVVVTRYFGGTLLGTGGLVRAYSQSTKEGVVVSQIVNKLKGYQVFIRTDYNGIGKIQYIYSQMQLQVIDTRYTDIVEVELVVPVDKYNEVQSAITEATSGRSTIRNIGEVWYYSEENSMS